MPGRYTLADDLEQTRLRAAETLKAEREARALSEARGTPVGYSEDAPVMRFKEAIGRGMEPSVSELKPALASAIAAAPPPIPDPEAAATASAAAEADRNDYASGMTMDTGYEPTGADIAKVLYAPSREPSAPAPQRRMMVGGPGGVRRRGMIMDPSLRGEYGKLSPQGRLYREGAETPFLERTQEAFDKLDAEAEAAKIPLRAKTIAGEMTPDEFNKSIAAIDAATQKKKQPALAQLEKFQADKTKAEDLSQA